MLAWCFSRYRARISRSDQLGAAHIAYEDPLIPIDNLGRELMQGIVPSARRPAVQALRLTPMAAPLCLGDFALEVPIETTRLELLPVAGRDRLFQTLGSINIHAIYGKRAKTFKLSFYRNS
jgi:hypothetical protein